MLNSLEHLIDEVEEHDKDLFEKLAIEVGEIEEKITDIEEELDKVEVELENTKGTVDYIVEEVLKKLQNFRDYGILNGGDTLESLLDELTNDLNEVYYGNNE